MMPDKQKPSSEPEQSGWPSVNIGNASNPSPADDKLDPSPGEQLLDDHAEKYLREVANIEDMPDAEDEKTMDEVLNDNKEDQA